MIIDKDEPGGVDVCFSQVNCTNDALNKLEIVCCTYRCQKWISWT